MRGLGYDRILAGTALALVLATPVGVYAQSPATEAVPLPDSATLPPPTASDLKADNTKADNTTTESTPAQNTTAESAKTDNVEAAPTGSVEPAGKAAQPEPATTTAEPAAPKTEPAPAKAEPAVTPAAPATTPTDTATAPAAAPAAAETATAPEAAPPPDPFASLDPADRPIAEKVRELLAAKVDRIFGNKKERAAVEAFYDSRKNALLWLDKGVVTARAKAAIARLKAADADGLDPADYKAPNFDAAQGADALAEAELRLTATVLTYARHVQAGRFPYSRISRDIEMPQQPPEPADVLNKVAEAGNNVAKALDEFSPPQEGYKRLKAKLAELRGRSGAAAGQLADGPVLKLAKVPMEDPRVPLLRTKLNVAGDHADQRYDAKVADAVKKFQRINDLPVTGALDARTVRELNGPPRDRQIDTIIVNMERWRWLPRDLGRAYVMVNIPDYHLRVYKDGNVVWTTRIVVGKPGTHATPILTAPMKYITVNPTWNVPPSIVQNEYLPALAQDPTVLARMGLKVVNNRDGSVHIYQPPGDGNALGRVRFNFPNRFLVYQHDTPDKHLFAHETRAYSHGCMRVQDPPKYAEILLNIVRPNEGWTAERIKRMYGSAEQDIQFPTFIPVNLTYQTAFVDDAGQLQMRRDIYGIDSRMLAAVRSERGPVEMAQDRPRDSGGSSVKRARAPQPQQPARTVSFFEALFGGGGGARPVPPNRVR